MDRLKDMLLFPRKLYSNLSASKGTLVAGIVFVGALDILFPLVTDNFRAYFSNEHGLKSFNIIVTLLAIAVLGLVDVAFFSIPMADLFKVFRKEREPSFGKDMRIIVMKVYIMAHILVVPVEIFLYYVFKDMNLENLSFLGVYGITLILVLPIIWFNALISRGINTVYQFQPLFKRLVFPVVFVWSFLISEAMHYIIHNWVIKLYVI